MNEKYYQNINNDTAETDRFKADVYVQQDGDDSVEMPQDPAFIPESLESELYMPGYLRTQIGKYMRVEFLIGNQTTDVTGRLTDVGASFIILELLNENRIVCDLFTIKFVTIYERPQIIMRKG